jgi:hypothetical protein
LLVAVFGLGLGGCADEGRDYPNPRDVVGDFVVADDEPVLDTVVENARPYQRPDHVGIGDDVTPDRVFRLGLRSRAAYDRLRGAGLVR